MDQYSQSTLMNPLLTPLQTPPRQTLTLDPPTVRRNGAIRSYDQGPIPLNLDADADAPSMFRPRISLNETPLFAQPTTPGTPSIARFSPMAPPRVIPWRDHNYRLLRFHVRNGNIEALRSMKDLDLSSLRANDNEVLRLAAMCGQADVLRYIRGFGLTVEDARTNNNEALRLATHCGSLLAIEALHAYGLTYEDARYTYSDSDPSAIGIAENDGSDDIIEAFNGWKAEETQIKCEGETMSCPICSLNFLQRSSENGLMPVSIAVTPCRHAYHRSCLLQWFTMDTTCPMCRASLTGTSYREIDIPGGVTEERGCQLLMSGLNPTPVVMTETFD